MKICPTGRYALNYIYQKLGLLFSACLLCHCSCLTVSDNVFVEKGTSILIKLCFYLEDDVWSNLLKLMSPIDLFNLNASSSWLKSYLNLLCYKLQIYVVIFLSSFSLQMKFLFFIIIFYFILSWSPVGVISHFLDALQLVWFVLISFLSDL